jgi:peptide/nickel transport system permease protein
MKKNKHLMAGIVIEAVFLCLLALSFFALPYDPFAMDAAQKLRPPSTLHFFGTDNLGRDIFSRTLAALRYTLLFSLAPLALSGISGITAGLALSASPRAAQQIAMRVLDAVNAIPTVLLALVLSVVFARGTAPLVITLAVVFLPSFVRIARNEAAKIHPLEYIQRARVQGASTARILFVHILPNIASPLIASSVIVLTNSIILESILSYLGLGIQPPAPSLGKMIFDAQSFLSNAAWGAFFPGAAIVLLAAGFHYIGEGIMRQRAG